MEENKKIRFEAEGSGLFSFIEKAKASMKDLNNEGRSLYEKFVAEAKKENVLAKDQNRYAQDQLKVLREALKIEKELTKEKLAQNRLFQEELVGSSSKWSQERKKTLGEQETSLAAKLVDIESQEKVANAAREQRVENKPQKQSFFGDMLKAELFRDLVSLTRALPHAKTGLELVSPVFQAAGGLTGMLGGAAASVLTGNPAMAGILGTLGKEAGGFVGDSIVRGRTAEDEYLRSKNEFTGLTGRGIGLPGDRNQFYKKDISKDEKRDFYDIGIREVENLEQLKKRFSNMGFTDAEAVGMMSRASRSGGAAGNENQAAGIMGLHKGFGIEESLTLQAIGMQRQGGGNGLVNIQKTLGIAVGEGLDRTRFADAIKQQVGLIEKFSSASNTVDVDRINEVLFGLSRLGGAFAIGDPRAMGKADAIEQGLSNPNDPFAQAQNYAVLRRLNPDMNAWELRKLQQKGLQTPDFLEGVMQDIDKQTSSDTFKKFQLQGRFPGLNMDDIDTMWSGFKKGDQMFKPQTGQMGLGQIEGQAGKFTTDLQRQQAEIQNAFKENFITGISAVVTSFKAEMIKAGSEVSEAWRKMFSEKALMSVSNKYDDRGRAIIKSDGAKTPRTRGSLSDPKITGDQQRDVQDMFDNN